MFYVEIAGDDRITKKRGYRGLSLWAPLVSRILGRHGPTRHPHGSFLSSLYKRIEKEDDHATTARLHRERNPKRQWRPTATPSSPRRRRRRGGAELREAAASLVARRSADEDALRRRATALDADLRRLQASLSTLAPTTLDKVTASRSSLLLISLFLFLSPRLLPIRSLSLSLTRRLVRVSAAWN